MKHFLNRFYTKQVLICLYKSNLFVFVNLATIFAFYAEYRKFIIMFMGIRIFNLPVVSNVYIHVTY